MVPPRRSSRLRSPGDIERRALIEQMMAENREGLGMRGIAVMVQRYGVLPKEMWDLNSISDMGAARGIKLSHSYSLPRGMFPKITGNDRYSIINLTIERSAHRVALPGSLMKLTILAADYNYPLNLPANLHELTFGYHCNYNQPVELPDNLRKLEFGKKFNLPISLPSTLVDLKLGSEYNRPLLLPQALKRLAFAWNRHFNFPLALPAGLVSIHFADSYDQPTVLPSSVEELRIGSGFTHDLTLPNSLRKIEWCCNRPLQIPEGVSEVKFQSAFNQPLILPPDLRKATFSMDRYSHPINFPPGLGELSWSIKDSADLVLPERLQKLTWSSDTNVRFPSGLRELEHYGAAPLVLPPGLLKIKFNSCESRLHYDLPESVQEVDWSVYSNHRLFTHPTTLQHLIVRYSHGALDLSRMKVHKLTIDDPYMRIREWPQGLKELAFTAFARAMNTPLRVPNGVRIVGSVRPTNVIME